MNIADCFFYPPVTENPDLELIKTADKEIINSGDEITYTLTLKNTGPTVINNLVIKDFIPAKTTFVSADKNGTLETVDGRPCAVWQVGSLESGQSYQVRLTVKSDEGITQSTQIENVAIAGPPDGEDPGDVTSNTVVTRIPSDQGGKIPKTGDTTALAVVVMLAVLAATVGTSVALRRRRQK